MTNTYKETITIILLLVALVLLLFLKSGSIAYHMVWGLAVACVVLVAVFHRKITRPLRAIANGVYMLREQDFTNRLAHVGDKEADQVVDLFNGMMMSLKRERRKLREQDYLLALLIDVSPMGIILLEPEGVIQGANRAAADFLGFSSSEEMKGRLLTDSGSRLGSILAQLKDKEVRGVRLNDSMVYRCSRLTFMESGRSHPFILVEKLTDEVMKAERKSYEKVIRMMAHEVNNSLASMITVIGTAAKETEDADMAEALTVCERRCRDMGAFITKFASAVKIPEPVRVSTDLTYMLRSWMPTFESICAMTGAKFTMQLPDEKLMVAIDAVQIEQALINIVKNAAESAGEGGAVELRLDKQQSFDRQSSLGKHGATLTITDNGPGISPEAAEMLFVPFFTTKPSGHGFGLLLVSEVLNAHHCRFSLETGTDGLTRFRIRFT